MSEIDGSQFASVTKASQYKSVCENESMSTMIKTLGITYNYIYRSQDGVLLLDIDIDKAWCGF